MPSSLPTSSHALNVARAAGDLWKFRLRRSVRLLLALGEPEVSQQSEARLRLVERQLLMHLLRARPGQPPLVSSLPQARAIVELAQTALLSSEAMVLAILAEFTANQAINPVKDAVYKHLL